MALPRRPRRTDEPARHYVQCGAAEGRDRPALRLGLVPMALPDVAAAVNPLVHYLHYGGVEGATEPLFDGGWYLNVIPMSPPSIPRALPLVRRAEGRDRIPLRHEVVPPAEPGRGPGGATPRPLPGGRSRGGSGPGRASTRAGTWRRIRRQAWRAEPAGSLPARGQEAGLPPRPPGRDSSSAPTRYVCPRPPLGTRLSRLLGPREARRPRRESDRLLPAPVPPIRRTTSGGQGFTEWTNVAGPCRSSRPTSRGCRRARLLRLRCRDPAPAGRAGPELRHPRSASTSLVRGRRLSERPSAVPRRPLPSTSFCVCWANENWFEGVGWLGARGLIPSHSGRRRRYIELRRSSGTPYLRVGGMRC